MADGSVPSIAPKVAARDAGLRPVLLGARRRLRLGQATLSRGIEYILGVGRVGRVCTDDYHRYDRATRAELGVTPLAPEANRMDLMAEHLRALRRRHRGVQAHLRPPHGVVRARARRSMPARS